MGSLLISRNAILLTALLAFVTWASLRVEKAIERHDARVSREAVTNTITKIETANAEAIKAGKKAAEKSGAPPLPPPRKPLAPRVRPVAGAVLDPTTRDDEAPRRDAAGQKRP